MKRKETYATTCSRMIVGFFGGWDFTAAEKVYDAAWGDADKRKPDPKGKLPAVGNTVDVANATWSNTIGDPS